MHAPSRQPGRRPRRPITDASAHGLICSCLALAAFDGALTIAQTERVTRFVWEIMLWLAILLTLIAVIVIAGLIMRRRLNRPEDPMSQIPFTLADLRHMRDAGQISIEEFERAKSNLVRQTTALGRDDAHEPPDDRPELNDQANTDDDADA